MAVFMTEGRFGSGKTAYSVFLAHELAGRRGRCPIWANFSLVGAKPIYTMPELYDLRGGVLVLDELQGTIHARRSSHNLEFLEWFDQVRKQDTDVICITQAFHKVDVIVREMVDVGLSCERIDETYSNIVVIDMVKETVLADFTFDRSVAYRLYDDHERAWALKGAKDVVKESVGAGKVRTLPRYGEKLGR